MMTHPLLIPALVVLALGGVESPSAAAASGPDAASPQSGPPSGIAAAEVEAASAMSPEALLEFAFETASAIPADPHLRDRSRTQEQVVLAAIALGRLEHAESWLPRIEDWRRGSASADLAYELAAKGDSPQVRSLIASAASAAVDAGEWQSERVLMKIARVQARLGELEAAAAIAATLEPVEGGKVLTAISERTSEAGLDEEIARIEAGIANGQRFDEVASVLDALTLLHRRVYADEARRQRLEAAADAAWRWVPLKVRMERRGALLRNALEAGDREAAARWLAGIAEVVEGYDWTPEDRVPLLAELAGWRFLAGDLDGARAAADASRRVFDEGRILIIDVFRGEALRPLAEAYMSLGDRGAAAEVYSLALDEAFVNPNARPRAIDLALAAVSMARRGFEPDTATADRLRSLRQKLDHPW